nr:hypothetical protein BaRGS_015910 [Batillaria attramentaria]
MMMMTTTTTMMMMMTTTTTTMMTMTMTMTTMMMMMITHDWRIWRICHAQDGISCCKQTDTAEDEKGGKFKPQRQADSAVQSLHAGSVFTEKQFGQRAKAPQARGSAACAQTHRDRRTAVPEK